MRQATLRRRYGHAREDKTDSFTRQYLETALWSTNDESDESGGEPLDSNYGIEDIDSRTRALMKKDAEAFQRANAKDLAEAYASDVYIEGRRYNASNAGHDFWLTRAGHGAGFWDCGLGDVGRRLSDAARAYGDFNLYVQDGKIITD